MYGSTENSMFFQLFDMVDIGLVIFNKDLRIRRWKRWMQSHPLSMIIIGIDYFKKVNDTCGH
jgi:predicted signal transduction protein with EAL and GGDEF domain